MFRSNREELAKLDAYRNRFETERGVVEETTVQQHGVLRDGIAFNDRAWIVARVSGIRDGSRASATRVGAQVRRPRLKRFYAGWIFLSSSTITAIYETSVPV